MSTIPFEEKELRNRLQQIQGKMTGQGLDFLLLTRPENIYYVTGFRAAKMSSSVSRFLAVVVPSEGEPKLFTRVLEREIAKLQWTKDPVLYMDHENPFLLLSNFLKGSSGAAKMKLGAEYTHLTVWQYDNLRAASPNAELVDATGLVDGVRVVPSKLESEFIRKAAKITETGFNAGIDALRIGAYRYEVHASIQEALFKAGQTDSDSSFVAVWSGTKGGRMHDTSTDEKIHDGDTVTIEVHGIFNQYRAVSQGTVYVGRGPIPESVTETFDLVSRMFRKAKDSLKLNLKTGEVYNAANSVYRTARGSDYFRRVGGTVGMSVFDIDFRKGGQETLKPGMGLIVQTLTDDPVLVCCVSTLMLSEHGVDELTVPLLEPKRVG
ncbi:MAG: Xaa-Pro peptidase family protein [Thaumarchaeota archaeon]|nr:Xaa-Pro peptidase family protein [Nitrososphaerota archaeon]